MSTTPLSSTPGTVSAKGYTVLGVKTAIPSQPSTNDATHVQLDPDVGRLMVRHPVTGETYGTVASTVASTSAGVTTLIKEF